MRVDRYTKAVLTAIAVALTMITLVIPARWLLKVEAQQGTGPPGPFTYVAKFACVSEVGTAETVGTTESAEVPFLPALYRTAVNVRNPGPAQATFTRTFVRARSENILPREPVSAIVARALGPGEALAIDCIDIQVGIPGGQSAMPGDGFVTIVSANQLDVVAVYTGLIIVGHDQGAGLGLAVEYIRPR